MIRLLNILVLTLLCTPIASAFQLISLLRWDTDAANRMTLWVDFDAEFWSFAFEEKEFADGSDPFAGIAAGQEMATILKLILDDYNAIQTSYLRLAFHPRNNANPPALANPTSEIFSDEAAAERTITIKLGGSTTALAAAGEAAPEFDDEYTKIDGCRIVVAEAIAKNAEEFKVTLTHEIGHCIGLGHSQNDRESIMSYNIQRGVHALGIDDKMGVTFLYPTDDAYADEQPNLGLGCSRSS